MTKTEIEINGLLFLYFGYGGYSWIGDYGMRHSAMDEWEESTLLRGDPEWHTLNNGFLQINVLLVPVP